MAKMTSDDAREITGYWNIDQVPMAVSRLRRFTGMSVTQAVAYLKEHYREDTDNLFVQMCTDFVQSPQDRLMVAREERRRLDLYIEDLEAQVESQAVHNNVFDQHKIHE